MSALLNVLFNNKPISVVEAAEEKMESEADAVAVAEPAEALADEADAEADATDDTAEAEVVAVKDEAHTEDVADVAQPAGLFVDPRQAEWDIMVNLVGLDETGLDGLTAAGILNIGDVELFGSGAALQTAATSDPTPLASITGMNPMTRQKFQVVATYLLNDGKLTTASSIDDMARYNLAKATTPAKKPVGRPPKNGTPSKSATGEPIVKRPRGRPRKNPVDGTPGSSPPPGPKRPRGRPRKHPVEETPSSSPAPKRPRGRPHKDGTTPAGGSTGKKPVGRPRKLPLADGVASAASPAPASANRPVGRPRKDGAPAGSSPSSASKATETYRGPPTHGTDKLDNAEAGWPDGWIQVTVERTSATGRKSRVDNFWNSPGGNHFRSMVEVRKFMKALALPDIAGDETEAWKIFKTIELK